MSERKTRWLLALLLLGQLSLAASQAPGPGGRAGSYLQALFLHAVAPAATLVDSTARAFSSLARGLSTHRRLRAENRRLRAANEDLERRAAQALGMAGDLARLQEALQYSRGNRPVRFADVVYIDHNSWLQTLLLRVGAGGAWPNQPVITAEGLVGRVVAASGAFAKVQLITDRAASVGAMVERTRRQGVVQGAGSGALRLEFVPLLEDVRVGDRIVTAGIDGVYPRGVPVGVVASVSPGEELFQEIDVAPAVDFARIDHAYVLDVEPIEGEIEKLEPGP